MIETSTTVTIPEALKNAVSFHQAGQLDQARQIYQLILQAEPSNCDALHLLGRVMCADKKLDKAYVLVKKAVDLNNYQFIYHYSLGEICSDLGDIVQAIECFKAVLQINDQHIDSLFRLAITYQGHGQHKLAIQYYKKILNIEPKLMAALSNLGLIYLGIGQHEKAIKYLQQAFEIDGDNITLNINLALAYYSMADYKKSVSINQKALALEPGNTLVVKNLTNNYVMLKQYDDAMTLGERILESEPNNVEVIFNLAEVSWIAKNLPKVLDLYYRLIEISPDNVMYKIRYEAAKLDSCLWDHGHERLTAKIISFLENSQNEEIAEIEPLYLLRFGIEPSIQLKYLKKIADSKFNSQPLYEQTRNEQNKKPLVGAKVGAKKIKIAYLSSDIKNHPVGNLIVGLIENHNRNKFEISLYSTSNKEGSNISKRVNAACDRYRVISSSCSDEHLAQTIFDDGIEILIDLNGLTEGLRIATLAQKPAPIQVSFLGYPASTGAPYMDYIIADSFVASNDKEAMFTEAIITMPDTYLPFDNTTPDGKVNCTKAEYGFCEDSIVLCCFNSSYKITPELFDIWMHLLKEIPTSVLWLSVSNDYAMENLKEHARISSVDPERLVFTTKAKNFEDYLARYQVADLFLDTPIYNAHSTAMDCLWGGCPMITCAGDAFASRVAGSLLRAAGIPELITYNLVDYRELALKLGKNPDELRKIRDKLNSNKHTAPLFDSKRYAQNFEAALETMWGKYIAGKHPEAFSVGK